MDSTWLPTRASDHELHRWPLAFLLVFALGCTTRFAGFFGTTLPAMDEINFAQYLSGYFTHQFYFDTHPPLGKLLVAGFAALFGFQPVVAGMQPEVSFSAHAYALRFLPELAGALLPVVILLAAREFGLNLRYAVLAALLVVFENALIAHSRFVYFDNFLLLFGFASLWLLLRGISRPSLRTVAVSGALAGMACAVKWTAMTFVLLNAALMLVWLRTASVARGWQYLVAWAVPLVGIYVAIFALHFALLYLPGPGAPFMPALHQKLLANAAHQPTAGMAPNFWQSLVDVHREMYLSNKRMSADHPYGSKWYQWPWMWKPIYHLQIVLTPDRSGDSQTYSMPNPAVWIGCTLAVISACTVLAWQALRSKVDVPLLWLVAAYFLNWLPFAGIHRVMFLYHYYAAFLFSALILARYAQLTTWRKVWICYGVLVVVGFAVIVRFTYGLPVDMRWIDTSVLRAWR